MNFHFTGKCLLVLDGAKCHIDLNIVNKAEELEIELLCLPSNTTHELQPLDKAVFRPFEINWDTQVELFWGTLNEGDRKMSKQRFGRVFAPTWDATMTAKNIKAGKIEPPFLPKLNFVCNFTSS